MVRLSYEQVKETFESKECQLLTTKDEFDKDNMHSKSLYKIISKCGHENTVKYDMFKAKNSGTYCKKCVSLVPIVLGAGNGTEYNGFCIIRDELKEYWDVKKMVEGTKADFAIKPKEVLVDEWLPVQLKVSIKPSKTNSNNYSFKCTNKNYFDMVVLCFCLDDKRTWMFNGDDLLGSKHLSIGSKRSIYTGNEVMFHKISEKLKEFYDNIKKEKIDIINIPISEQQQREQEYRRKREALFPYLDFVYPEEEALEYDFKVGDRKFQEKVATHCKKRGKLINFYSVNVWYTNPYKKGDNDFYWINIPNSKFFYLFPESVMILHNYVKTDTNVVKKKMMFLSPLKKMQ